MQSRFCSADEDSEATQDEADMQEGEDPEGSERAEQAAATTRAAAAGGGAVLRGEGAQRQGRLPHHGPQPRQQARALLHHALGEALQATENSCENVQEAELFRPKIFDWYWG